MVMKTYNTNAYVKIRTLKGDGISKQGLCGGE